MPRKRNRVTILDVAAEAGVSKSTAARVLTKSGFASPDSAERVRDAADRLGYTPNSLARAMVSGETKTLGVIVTDISSTFFSTVVRGFSDVARAEGFEVFLSSVDQDSFVEERALQALTQKQVDGVAVAPVVRNVTSSLSQLTNLRVPLVLLDRPHPAAPDAPVIMLDHEASAQQAVERLINHGHSRIALVTDDSTANRVDDLINLMNGTEGRDFLTPSELRLLGYLETLDRHGVSPDPNLIVGADYDQKDVTRQVAKVLRSSNPPTAVFATDALFSSGAFHAVKDSDLVVPDDLSFIAFDDQEWCTMVHPGVSTVTQPQYDLGAEAARLLIAAIRGSDVPPDQMLLPSGFIERESIGPVSAIS
jgi:LacI family transcriptional regulator